MLSPVSKSENADDVSLVPNTLRVLLAVGKSPKSDIMDKGEDGLGALVWLTSKFFAKREC